MPWFFETWIEISESFVASIEKKASIVSYGRLGQQLGVQCRQRATGKGVIVKYEFNLKKES